ncbi:MAG: TlpA disulfide reductase family protein [Gemmatimonadaceae bacterium]|nr:TlpA disulfide reductase family protein [Gemmatimonadaceae bacterium]
MRVPKFRFRFHWEALLWLALGIFVGHRLWPQVAAAAGVSSSDVAAAPAFQLTTLDGHVVTSDQLRGKVVLLNFWASWCPPCRFEMPGFQSVYDRNKNKDFVVVGVSMDAGSVASVQKFLAENHITYPVAMATGDVVESYGGVNLLPTSFLIDKQGRIRNEVHGIFAAVALEQAVQRLLADSTADAAGT